MQISKLRRYIPVFRIPAWRVLLETAIVQTIFTLVYPLISGDAFHGMRIPEARSIAEQQAMLMILVRELYYFFFCMLSLIWYVLRWRLRPAQRTRWRQCLYEIGMSINFCLELIVSQIILSLILSYLPPFAFLIFFPAIINTHRANPDAFTLYILPFFCACAFIFLRSGVYILLLWNRLRKTHIVWSLTHAQIGRAHV